MIDTARSIKLVMWSNENGVLAGSVFHRLLDKFYRGEPDAHTVQLLAVG